MPDQGPPPGVLGDLSEIGRDLLAMEISTIASDAITGRKMPWFPHAVIDVLTKYADWLAAVRAVKIAEILALPKPLTRDTFKDLVTHDINEADTPVTNGWRSIEQLRRTAKFLADDHLMAAIGRPPLNHLERGIAIRIRRNCDQLKSIVLRFRAIDAWQPYFLTAEARDKITEALVDTAADEKWTDFRSVDLGLSRAQITRSLEASTSLGPQRAVLDSDAATRLRKIWELGTDRIIAQTIVHVDGDTVTRFQRGVPEEDRAYYLEIHNQGVRTAVDQWRTLFDAFSALVGGLADRIFGR